MSEELSAEDQNLNILNEEEITVEDYKPEEEQNSDIQEDGNGNEVHQVAKNRRPKTSTDDIELD